MYAELNGENFQSRISTILQCQIDNKIRNSIISVRKDSLENILEKYMIQLLNRATIGLCKENSSRRQIFIDIASSFNEFSLCLAQMNRDEIGTGNNWTGIKNAANWVLKLNMAILVEDWETMDLVIEEASEHKAIDELYSRSITVRKFDPHEYIFCLC